MAETVPEAMVHEVDEILGSGIDKLKETIANDDEKIDKRIGALLLLLRSRSNVEENMQVGAHPASPQLSESPDLNRPEPKPNYVVNVTPDAPNASSPFSNRRYKLRRRVSCEEIDERRLKGLCAFCEEPETPYHYLQHKNSGILMIDSEDHLSNAMELEDIEVEISSDMWQSHAIGCKLETGETAYDEDRFPSDSDLVMNAVEKVKNDLVEIEAAKSCDDEQFLDNGKVFGFNMDDSETDSWIEQNQLSQEQDDIHPTDSVMEPSLESSDLLLSKGNYCLASDAELIQQLELKDCVDDLPHVVLQTKLELIHTKMMLPFFLINITGVAGTAEKFRELPTITNKSYAIQWLDKMSLQQDSQNMKKKKASKSWMFKYKNQKQCKGRAVWEEWFHLTSRVTIQRDPGLYFLLVAASTWCTRTHFGYASYHVWHRWKARYLQSFNNRIWDPGGSIFRNFSFKLKLWF